MSDTTERTLYRVTYASAGCLPESDPETYPSREQASVRIVEEFDRVAAGLEADGLDGVEVITGFDVEDGVPIADPTPGSLYAWTLEPIGWDEPLPDGEDGEELAEWFLELDGGDAPGCTWGTSPARFHPVIVAACRAWCRAADEPMTFRHLDHWDGLVVNSHDDVAHTLDNYATDEELDAIGYSRDDVRELHACCD